jgi:hypothetical protein
LGLDYRLVPVLLAWAVVSCVARPAVAARPPADAVNEAQVASLKESARRAGAVRVIVDVGIAEQVRADAAKRGLVGRLQGADLLHANAIAGTGYVVLEVTPRGLDRLVRDPAVKAIQEDSTAAPQ